MACQDRRRRALPGPGRGLPGPLHGRPRARWNLPSPGLTTRRTSCRCRRPPARTSTRPSSARAPTAGWRTWPRRPRPCAGRMARVRRVAPGTRLVVIPASSQVLQEALAAGYIETFLAAGAMLGTPGCGPCMGNHLGIPAAGETVISSANRNFRGRMGNPESEVYLASPAVVAASVVLGRIAGPDETRRISGKVMRTQRISAIAQYGNISEASLSERSTQHATANSQSRTNRKPAIGNRRPCLGLRRRHQHRRDLPRQVHLHHQR